MDTETGQAMILNRAQFNARAEERLGKAAPMRLPVTLILVSIDNYRECGGTAAEICLRSVTDVVRANTNPVTDLAGLVRNHQFALMPADCSPKCASELAERIRIDVESLQIRPTVDGGPLTVSVSATIKIPKAKPSIEALLIAADRGLREAMRLGGNCVIMDESWPLDSRSTGTPHGTAQPTNSRCPKKP